MKNKRVQWKKGNGEFIGFTLISICISSIIIILIAVLQYSNSLNDITKALEVASRAAAVCTSYDDAQTQAQTVAESAVTNADLENISVDVAYAGGSNTWQSGTFLTVTVTADYNNILYSGTGSRSALVTVENTTGQVITIPESYDGIPIGSNMTVTVYDSINWTAGTAQREVYDAWVAAGKRYLDGIAVLDGYYLIACTTLYGQVGDRVQFTLENGQVLNCIIADAKSSGDSNYTIYGHIHSGKILVLEMEVDGDYYSRYGNPATDDWKPEWNSRPVRCRNMGSYFS